MIIAPYPFLYNVKYHEHNTRFNADLTYEINDLLLFFCFIRIYLLIRFILVITQFMNPRSMRVCMMHGCEANIMFAVKAIMKQKPYTILWVSLVISSFIFGF